MSSLGPHIEKLQENRHWYSDDTTESPSSVVVLNSSSGGARFALRKASRTHHYCLLRVAVIDLFVVDYADEYAIDKKYSAGAGVHCSNHYLNDPYQQRQLLESDVRRRRRAG